MLKRVVDMSRLAEKIGSLTKGDPVGTSARSLARLGNGNKSLASHRAAAARLSPDWAQTQLGGERRLHLHA